MLKNYGYSLLLFFISIFIITLFITLFSYFNLLSTEIISISYFIIILLSIFISSYILGTKSKEKGYLEGLKLGGLIILIFLLLTVIFDKFTIKSLVYYVILTLTSILGSMIGINKNNN